MENLQNRLFEMQLLKLFFIQNLFKPPNKNN